MEIKRQNYTPNFQALIFKNVPIPKLQNALKKNEAIKNLAENYNVIVKSFRNKSSVIPENYTKVDISPYYAKDYYLYGIKFDVKTLDGKERIGNGGLYFATENNPMAEYIANNHLKDEISQINVETLINPINKAFETVANP